MGDAEGDVPEEESGEPFFTFDTNEPIDIVTAFLIIIIALVLFSWYYSVSERRKQEYNEKISKLKVQIDQVRCEVAKVQRELEKLRKYKEATICEDILATLDTNLQQLALEFRKAQYGDDYDKFQATRVGKVKIQIDEALQESLNLREKLEALKNSVIIPETRCIVETFGKRNITPAMVVKCIAEKIQDNKNKRMNLSRKSKELSEQIRCVEERLKDEEETIMELKKETDKVRNDREYNQILERQKLDNRCAIQKLREYNAQKESCMLDSMEEIKGRDEQIFKINKEVDEVISHRTKTVPLLRERIAKRDEWSLDMLSKSEDIARFLQSIKTQMEADFNADVVRQMIGKKMGDFQRFMTQISSKIAQDDKVGVQSGNPMGDSTGDAFKSSSGAQSCGKSWSP